MASKRTIGVLSKETKVKVTTIRYYETIGFLHEPDRSASGQRIYPEGATDRLKFIKHARDLGFSMKAVKDLLDLQDEPMGDCNAVDDIASRQLDSVRERIRQLKSLERELEIITTACKGGRVEDCRVFASLNDHSLCSSEHAKRASTQE